MANLLDLKHQPETAALEEDEQQDEFDDQIIEEAPVQELAWDADLRRSDEPESRRYTVMTGIALIAGSIAWWQSSWLLLFIALLAVGAWELRERLEGSVPVRIDATGIRIGSDHYPHARLASFDVHEHADYPADLSVVTNAWHAPLLRISIGDQDPTEVRQLLAQYVPYEEHPVPLIERLMRRR